MPGVQISRAVAEVLIKGLGFLHSSAKIAVLVGLALGVVLEIIGKRTHGRFPISGVGLGLAFVIKFSDAFNMFLGSFLFWFLARKLHDPKKTAYRIFVDNRETLAAGAIAGGSIIGIVLILLETAL
jgi:uncharacterized oligopeptide transporter (OPT) family protein